MSKGRPTSLDETMAEAAISAARFTMERVMREMPHTSTYTMRALLAAAVVICAVLIAASPAWAATITVNSLADTAANDGECTLREAITAANTDTASGTASGECAAGSGDDLIDIGATGTVNLTGFLPSISSNMEIEGPGADHFAVSGDTEGTYRIFTVVGGSVVSISGIAITNANIPVNFGGGIFNQDSDLTVTDSNISGNSAFFGGGIYNQGGDLTVTGSTISGNSAVSGSSGGGIVNTGGGTLTLTDSTVSGNSGTNGGGVYGEGGDLTLTDSTISGNSAQSSGGGVYVRFGDLTVSASTVSGNSAQFGGGVFSRADLSGTLTTTITDSTVSGNSAEFRGGGVRNSGGLTAIEQSTITDNTAPSGQGSGVASEGDALTRTEVLSTIISANTNTDVDFALGDNNSFGSNGYNVIGDGNATGAFNQTGDQIDVAAPGLDTLADNGGPTRTHALLSGSPAIDRVASASCQPPDTDQRGFLRPADGDGDGTAACDAGSFEKDARPPSLSIDNVSVTEGDSGTTEATFTVTLSQASEKTVTAFYATADNSANAPGDYTAEDGTTTFQAGDTSEQITVPVVGDEVDEDDETFFVNLSNQAGATISGGEGTIEDDDESPPPPTRTCTRTGTNGPDDIRGTNGYDRVCARGGNDTVRGLLGPDLLFGDAGADTLYGGQDNDRLVGGAGRDELFAGQGTNDVVDADDGQADRVDCGNGSRDLAFVDSKDTVKNCEARR